MASKKVNKINNNKADIAMMEGPKISIKESSQKEKQIVVDPLSLRESSIPQGSSETALSTVTTTLAAADLHCPSLHPPKPKFLSFSLPNSANSTPLFTSTLKKKKKSKGGSIESSPCQASNMTLKHQYLLQEMHLRRSKSYGEGRASEPSDDFDHLWLVKPNAVEYDNRHHDSFSKAEAMKESPVSDNKDMEKTPADEEGFKCSALCLYLPGFGKAKPVKARKEGSEMEGVVSRTVSLEKFECGSWASSALFHEIEGDPTNSYFDLPMELVKYSPNDVHAPVTSAFVFEKEGVLKNGSSRGNARKSDTSPHHVRFSISSSTSHPASPASCNDHHLRKAREDFNAYLEAQSA